MKRFDKKAYMKKLSEKSITIKSTLMTLDRNGLTYHEKKSKLANELEENRDKIKQVFSSATRILIATTQETKNGSIIYQHFYYLADLDVLQCSYSDGYDSYAKSAIDYRTFFSKIGLPKNSTIDTSLSLWFTIEIVKRIINYLFEKKNYHSWGEVKTDLITVKDTYDKPAYNENSQKYEKRVLKKH